MRSLFDLRSYPAQLVLGTFILILLTTLSAGLPAYWLTRTELERQTWSHVASAEQATVSLLQAEQTRLDNLLLLLAERPTLHRFLAGTKLDDLAPYLRAFQTQSDLDILFLCPFQGSAADREMLHGVCPQPLPSGFQLYQGRPAVIVTRAIPGVGGMPEPGIAVAGRWLDTPFLRQLASDTGTGQTILQPDGTRLASSLGAPSPSLDPAAPVIGTAGRRLITIGGSRYFSAYAPLPANAGDSALIVEVTLSVDELFATQGRARAILALSTGLVALLGMLLGMWAVRWLTGPLEQLTRSAEALAFPPQPSLGASSLAHDSLPPGPREIQTLAAALQRSQAGMLAALDDLAQAHSWLNSVVHSIVEGIITLNDSGHVTFINERAAASAGLTVEAARGRRVDELFAVADETGSRISLHRLPLGSKQRVTLLADRTDTAPPQVQPGQAKPGQRVLRRLSRNSSAPAELSTVLEITATRVAAPSGDELQTALILRDITEEESLRHLRAYFLANITHEFRTPLSTLSASMELLMHEPDLSPTEIRELLQPIHLSLLSLQTLIDNLLESSSIEAGRFVLRHQPVDLNRVIITAAQVVQPLLERRRQTLAVSQPALLPPLIGDATRLTQVLVNLLGNASKYSPIGAPIDLEVIQQGTVLRVAVADRGPGIPYEERELLFRRFVRGHAGTGEQYGIGLGLYVVKSTIEAHQGRVGVDDHSGGGSLFWFELPIAQTDI